MRDQRNLPRGAMMARLALAGLATIAALLSACGGDRDETTDRPRVIDRPTVRGIIFHKQDGGVDRLAGTRVKLIDRRRFGDLLERLRPELAQRFLEGRIRELTGEIEQLTAQQARVRARAARDDQAASRSLTALRDLRAAKSAEIEEFARVKWSNFVYTDPITRQQMRGSWFDGRMIEHMRQRLAELDARMAQQREARARAAAEADAELTGLGRTREEFEARRRERLTELRGYDESALQLTDEALLQRVSSRIPVAREAEQWILLRSTEQILERLDEATLHETIADERGTFAFTVEPGGDYLVFAVYLQAPGRSARMARSPPETDADTDTQPGGNVDHRAVAEQVWRAEPGRSMVWLTPVRWDGQGAPERVVLTDTNSLDHSTWFRNRRSEAMSAALETWVNGFY